MKVFYLFLIALLIVGCGPSAEQMTATADAVRALTQTAAPTLTPTATFTPSPSPTITPSPTPSIPKIEGRVQLIFKPLTEDTVVLYPPHTITITLSGGAGKVTIKADPADGSFSSYASPGKYVIESVSIKNPDLGPIPYDLVVSEAEIRVPSQDCYYAGAITFTLFRLPAGDLTEQSSLVQALSQRVGGELYFQYLESGGFIVPAFTALEGAGECSELPDAQEGFNWKYLPESSLAVLAPNDWHFLAEADETMRAYYISQEHIGGADELFKTGLTVAVLRKEGNVVQAAKDVPAAIMKTAGVDPVEVSERTEGNLTFFELEYEKSFETYDATIHNLIVANAETNVMYVITFESPSDEWEQAWEKGRVMLEQMLFLDNQ